MWAALLDQELGQIDVQRISSSVETHLAVLSSAGAEWEAASSRRSATAGYSRRSVDSRNALKQQRAFKAAQEQRNCLATEVRNDISGGAVCARALRSVLDVVVGCGCNVLPALGALCSLVLLCGYLDGSWAISGTTIMLPVGVGCTIGLLSCVVAFATELCSESAADRPSSACHRQANASRAFVGGICAYLALRGCRDYRSKGPTAYRRAKCVSAGAFVVLSALILLQLALLAEKVDDHSAMTWGATLSPALLILSLMWCVPVALPLDGSEEKASASAACFCVFSLPLLLTAMLFILRNDGDHAISIGGLLSPLLVVLSVLLCAACAVSFVAVQEGELEGSPAARAAFALMCCTVCCLAVAPVAFMSLLIEADEGGIVPVGFAPVAMELVNGSATNATVALPAGGDEISWFLVFIPLLCSGAFVCVAGLLQCLFVRVGAVKRSWRLQGNAAIPQREEELYFYV